MTLRAEDLKLIECDKPVARLCNTHIVGVQALYAHGGYNILDIRTKAQQDQFGQVPNHQRTRQGGKAIHVPYKTTRKYFEDGKQQVETQDNPDFWDIVDRKFQKDSPILVMDWDGATYGIEVLEGLDEEGFENIVGIKGGYKAWFKTWDQKLRRRNLGEYQEHGWGEGRDSTGIHASGAGFTNQDRASGDFWENW